MEKNGHIYKCVFVDLSITKLLYMTLGYRGSTVVKVVAGSIPASVTGFFIDIKSFRSHYGPGVDSTSNRNENQEYFLGGKAGRCLRLTTYHNPVPLSRNLGTLAACNGTDLPLSLPLYMIVFTEGCFQIHFNRKTYRKHNT